MREKNVYANRGTGHLISGMLEAGDGRHHDGVATVTVLADGSDLVPKIKSHFYSSFLKKKTPVLG